MKDERKTTKITGSAVPYTLSATIPSPRSTRLIFNQRWISILFIMQYAEIIPYTFAASISLAFILATFQ